MANIIMRHRGAKAVSGTIVARLLTGLVGMLRRERQRRALARLSDDLLRDIGLSRHDAEAECRKPFWRP